MDRNRNPRPSRRRTQPAVFASFFDHNEEYDQALDQESSLPDTFSVHTPQTAPQMRQGLRQSSIPASPSTATGMSLRKRPRTFAFGSDAPMAGDHDDDGDISIKKGSHNLRKRAKIDYSANDFEDELPEIALAAPRAASRKKRADSENVVDDITTPLSQQRKRATSRELSFADGASSGRRKTPARKVTENQLHQHQRNSHSYPNFLPSDDVVKDTIEVVGDSSDLHGTDEPSDHESQQDLSVAGIAYPSRWSSGLWNGSGITPSYERLSGGLPGANAVYGQHSQSTGAESSLPARDSPYPMDPNLQLSQESQVESTSPRTLPQREPPDPTNWFEPSPSRVPPMASGPRSPAPLSEQTSTPGLTSELSHAVHAALARPSTEDPQPQSPRQQDTQSSSASRPEDNPSSADAEQASTREAPRSWQEPLTAQRLRNSIFPQQPSQIQKTQARVYPWSHLTAYVEGKHVLHPEPSMQPAEGDEEDDSNQNGGAAEDAAENDTAETNGNKDDGQDDGMTDANADSAAPTPAPATPRAGSPAAVTVAPTGSNTPVPSEKSKSATSKAIAPHRRKQYQFNALRDPSELQEYLKDHESLPKDELYALLEHANHVLVTWEDEWHMRGRKVDDYENAKRRAQQDAEYERRTMNLDQFSRPDSYVERDFEVRGYRAPVRDKENGTFHQRWQDKVMASAYGFEYDPHVSKIGQQNPVSQRQGIAGGRQLRSQPQQTAKAAEAGEGTDGLVVVGKRTRNPPKLYDGLLQDDNRSAAQAAKPAESQPAPALRRRGRAAAAQETTAEKDYDELQQADAAANFSAASKPGPKRRGPRPRKSNVDTDADTPGPEQDKMAPPPLPPQSQEPQKRKRGRQPKSAAVVEEDDAYVANGTKVEAQEPPAKRSRLTRKPGPKTGTVLKLTSSQEAADTTDASRPSSSSSHVSSSDEGSTYGLRQKKRQRNFRNENDVDSESLAVMQPQARKRPRINFKQSNRTEAPVPPSPSQSDKMLANLAAVSLPSSATPIEGARIVRFKHHGRDRWTVGDKSELKDEDASSGVALPAGRPSTTPSAPPSATSSAAPSQAGEDNKDYSTMTKSEKMSASMKKRWMNGSMQNAVNKRKATLAAKKAAAAAAAAAATANAPTPPPQQPQPPVAMLQEPQQHFGSFINMNGQQGQ